MAKLGTSKPQYRLYYFLYNEEWKSFMKISDLFLKS